MPYLSWEFIAQFVQGEKRLREDVLLGHGETAESHPFFDEKAAAADRFANKQFRKAGYDTPLDEIRDKDVKNALAGYYVGLFTETLSSREPWMETAYKTGKAYLESIGKGEITLDEAELSDEPTGTGRSESRLVDEPVFDLTDPYAAAHGVFRELRAPRGRRW